MNSTDIANAAASLHSLCERITGLAQRAQQHPGDSEALLDLARTTVRAEALAGEIAEGARAIRVEIMGC